MSDLFSAPQPPADAPKPKRATTKTRKGPPPLSGAWYGPQEQVWLIPHPQLHGQPFRIQLSLITGASKSDYSTCCFIRLQGVQEPLLVGVSEASVLEHAPWAAEKPVDDPNKAVEATKSEPSVLANVKTVPIDGVDAIGGARAQL